MILEGEQKTLKNFSMLPYSLNATNKGAYHFYINYLNGFHPESARDKHYDYSSNSVTSMSRCLLRKKNGQQFTMVSINFKVSFTLDADFESILKSADEKYREKMNEMKTEQKVKTPYTEQLTTYVPPGWCVPSTFAYGDVLGPMEICCDKDSVEKFVEHIESEIKRMYEMFPQ